MDAVLGLSVTPSAVGVVLVEGHHDGVALDGERFEVGEHGPATAVATSERAAAAVLRTEAIASDLGRRVRSIGVTWSDDAGTEASLLLRTLRDSGFDNIVPVRLSEATHALARRIAEVLGYQTTAVCVIEPEQLTALVVSWGDDPDGAETAVQTAVNHTVVTEDDLVGWLSAVFTRADWQPEALALVGSADDLDGLLPVLEEALDVPVFSPAAAQLALARGAALACAPSGEPGFWVADERSVPTSRARSERPANRWSRKGPAALLVAGAVTLVASVSAAVALALAPESPAPSPRTATESVVRPQVAPPVAPPPAPVAPPPIVTAEDPVPEVPAATVEEPPVAPADVPPATDQLPPDTAPPLDAPAPPLDPPPPAVDTAPPAGIVAPVERPGILQRIRDRLSGIGDDAVPPPAALAPPPVPPLP